MRDHFRLANNTLSIKQIRFSQAAVSRWCAAPQLLQLLCFGIVGKSRFILICKHDNSVFIHQLSTSHGRDKDFLEKHLLLYISLLYSDTTLRKLTRYK